MYMANDIVVILYGITRRGLFGLHLGNRVGIK